MQNWIININVLILWSIQALHCQSIDLTPAEAYVDLHTSLTFTCTYKGYNEVIGTKWSVGNRQTPAIIRHQDGTCTAMGIFSDATIYIVGCPSEKSFKVTILSVQPVDLNSEWYCFDNNRKSNSVTIIENVPVANVLLSLLEASSGLMKEHTRQTIKCKTSTGRPQPKVSWYFNESTRSEIHKINVNATTQIIPSTESGLVAVESTLQFYPNRSFNTWVLNCKGWTNKESRSVYSNKISLNITYPPYVGQLPNISVIEGKDFKISCNEVPGNPNKSSYYWSSRENSIISEEKVLTILNVSRKNESFFTCTVTNEMKPTVGSVVKGNSSRTFYMTVFFPTEIRRFSLSTKNSRETVVINKTDNQSLVCIAEANPSSKLSIANPRGEYITEVSNSNVAHHTLLNASYTNAGEYTCTGRNNYTKDSPASLQLILVVRCPPMPFSGDKSVEKLSTIMHVDVTLSFLALKYLDEPNKTVFTWFKGNDQISDNDIKYKIRTEELQTNLSVRNTTDQDLGLYRVVVQNSVGEYVHYYELNAAATTHRPTETVCSTNIGTFLGVGAGSSLFTLVVVVCLLIGYKRYKKLKFSYRRSHKQGDTNKHKLSGTEESQVSSAYTDLDKYTKEVNVYDAVNVPRTSSQLQDTSTQGPCAYIKMKDTKDPTKDTLDYININI